MDQPNPNPIRIEPGKPKEPPEAGKVSQTEQPVIISSPPPRGIDEGEDQDQQS